MRLLYKVDQVGAALSVRLGGDLDISTASELRDVLLCAVGRWDATTVEVDLDEVTFPDAMSIGALVAACKAAGQAGSVPRQ